MKEYKMMFVVLSVFFSYCLLAIPAGSAEIKAQGSDSTLGLVKTLAQAYQQQSGDTMVVSGGGSSSGAKACLANEVDLAFLSRKLKDQEIKDGLAGVPYALDGVAVIVHPENTLQEISLEKLKAIYIGETTTWDDGKPLVAFNRNTESGTREVFHEIVLGKDAEFTPQAQIKHDAALLPAVNKIPNSIGYTSAGEVDSQLVKTLKIGGVEPSIENIRAGVYPISRTLTFATKGEAKGFVKAFLDFVLSEQGQKIVSSHGYVPLK
jgi:phosphate transport system substrate-binding protein